MPSMMKAEKKETKWNLLKRWRQNQKNEKRSRQHKEHAAADPGAVAQEDPIGGKVSIEEDTVVEEDSYTEEESGADITGNTHVDASAVIGEVMMASTSPDAEVDAVSDREHSNFPFLETETLAVEGKATIGRDLSSADNSILQHTVDNSKEVLTTDFWKGTVSREMNDMSTDRLEVLSVASFASSTAGQSSPWIEGLCGTMETCDPVCRNELDLDGSRTTETKSPREINGRNKPISNRKASQKSSKTRATNERVVVPERMTATKSRNEVENTGPFFRKCDVGESVPLKKHPRDCFNNQGAIPGGSMKSLISKSSKLEMKSRDESEQNWLSSQVPPEESSLQAVSVRHHKLDDKQSFQMLGKACNWNGSDTGSWEEDCFSTEVTSDGDKLQLITMSSSGAAVCEIRSRSTTSAIDTFADERSRSHHVTSSFPYQEATAWLKSDSFSRAQIEWEKSGSDESSTFMSFGIPNEEFLADSTSSSDEETSSTDQEEEDEESSSGSSVDHDSTMVASEEEEESSDDEDEDEDDYDDGSSISTVEFDATSVKQVLHSNNPILEQMDMVREITSGPLWLYREDSDQGSFTTNGHLAIYQISENLKRPVSSAVSLGKNLSKIADEMKDDMISVAGSAWHTSDSMRRQNNDD